MVGVKRKRKHSSPGPGSSKPRNTKEHLLVVILCGNLSHARDMLGKHDVNEPGPGGCLYLVEAARKSSPRMIQLLIDMGANMEARDNSGETALSKYRGRALSARVLIQNGADVSVVRDGDGFFNDDRTYRVFGEAGAARGIRVPFVPKTHPFQPYMRPSAYAFLSSRPSKTEKRQVRRIVDKVETPNTSRAHSLRALMAGFRVDLGLKSGACK